MHGRKPTSNDDPAPARAPPSAQGGRATRRSRSIVTISVIALLAAGASILTARLSCSRSARDASGVEGRSQALESSDDPAAQVDLALRSVRLGRFDEAAEHYRRALGRDPRNGLTWYSYGELLRTQLRDFRGAQDALRRATDLRPDMPEAHLGLGLVLLELDEPEDAAAAIESSLSLAPPNATWRADAENALLVARTRLAARQSGAPKPGGDKD